MTSLQSHNMTSLAKATPPQYTFALPKNVSNVESERTHSCNRIISHVHAQRCRDS